MRQTQQTSGPPTSRVEPLPSGPSGPTTPEAGPPAPPATEEPAAPVPAARAVPEWVTRAITQLLLGATGLVLAYWLLQRLRGLLVLLLAALFLAFAIEPAVNALARRGWRRGLATGAVFLFLTLAVAGFGATMGSLAVQQVRSLIDAVPGYVDQVVEFANDRFDTEINVSQSDVLTELRRPDGPLAGFAGGIVNNAVEVSGSIVGGLFKLLTVALFAFYLAADGPRFRRTVCRALPPERQRTVLWAWDVAVERTGGYVYSRALLAAASAIATGLALVLIGVPYPLPLALWVGLVSQFVPTVGTYLAGALPVLVALLHEPVEAIWVLGFILAYQQVENYVLAPHVTARTMSLHPAVAFGSVIAGAAVLGAVGALLAVPAAATIQSFLAVYVRQHDLVEQAAPGDAPPPARATARTPG